MRPPIFIIGNPRSGTTLLRLMLNNHSNIVIPPECGFIVWWHGKYYDWSGYSHTYTDRLDAFLSDLATSRKIETWRLDLVGLHKYVLDQQPTTYADLVSCVYEFFGEGNGKRGARWGDKNNFHVQHIDMLSALFPSAYFIHIIRDGRDVACSYRSVMNAGITSTYAPKLPIDICVIAREWVTNLETVIASFERMGWNRVHELRFEDLVLCPEQVLGRVCDFLSEPFDGGMLNYHEANRAEEQEPKEFLQWKKKTLERPDSSQVGRFRSELESSELEQFVQIARPILLRYDYR